MSRPPALWLYPVLLLQPFVVVTARGEANATVAGAFVLAFSVAFLVWRGNRAAWVLAALLQVGVVAGSAFDPRPPMWAFVLNLVALACLMAPSTRRYVWRGGRGRRALRPRAQP